MSKKILGIITARGGSKGIPGKNIKELCGKPLIFYTIEAAKKSGVLDRIIVSTDDEKIARKAREYGAEIPFIRPDELSQDNTQHLPVLQHAVKWLRENENYYPDYAILLQPTSPLRQAFHIKEAVDLILKTGADSVLSVAEIPEVFNPCSAMVIGEDNFLRLFNGQPVRKRIARRQERPKTYYSTSLFYLFKTDVLFDPLKPSFYGEKVAPYISDKKYLIDINVPEDWQKAEEAMKRLMR